jgi:hypothetical protein
MQVRKEQVKQISPDLYEPTDMKKAMLQQRIY